MTEKTSTGSVSVSGKQKGSIVGIVIAGILAAAGIGLWIYQLITGLVVTDMRNLNPWGLYITSFMFLVGLSAGGLIISSVPRVFGIKGFGGISKVAVWTSICCTVLAIAFVVVDLGQPLRLWELFAFANLSSPLMWDIIVISTYLIISVVYLVAMLRYEKGNASEKGLRVISTIALVVAILVHSVTAWIFGLQQSHEFWNTALLAPWFVVSALVSGLALVMIVVIALNKTGYLKLADENIVKMAKLLGTFIVVDLFFLGCELLTAGFPMGSGAEVVAMLTTGALAPFFWAEVIFGVLAAAICFMPSLRKATPLVVAAIFAIAGILLKRFVLLMAGFQMPNIDMAGAMTTYQLSDPAPGMMTNFTSLIYSPTFVEWGIFIGVIALGAFMLLVGLRQLPLAPNEKTE